MDKQELIGLFEIIIRELIEEGLNSVDKTARAYSPHISDSFVRSFKPLLKQDIIKGEIANYFKEYYEEDFPLVGDALQIMSHIDSRCNKIYHCCGTPRDEVKLKALITLLAEHIFKIVDWRKRNPSL
jgi:hypothetical protein